MGVRSSGAALARIWRRRRWVLRQLRARLRAMPCSHVEGVASSRKPSKRSMAMTKASWTRSSTGAVGPSIPTR